MNASLIIAVMIVGVPLLILMSIRLYVESQEKREKREKSVIIIPD